MTDQPNHGPLSGIEVRDSCPHCGDHQLIPRIQMAEHLARLHPEVPTRSPYASGGELNASFTPAPASECVVSDTTPTASNAKYPYPDGDVTVLGPEIFASSDGAVICWKGENYTRQPEPAPDDLREQYAALFRSPPGGERLGDEPPGIIAETVLAVRDTELGRLRAQVDELIRRNGEYADRGIANGERADKAEAALTRVHHVADLIAAGAPWTSSSEDTARRVREAAAVDGQLAEDPEKQRLRDELEDVRHNLAARAFTAPDADFASIFASLDARIRDALDQPQDDRPLPRQQRVYPNAKHRGGNAENCQACDGTNPPYPFLCPGPQRTFDEGVDALITELGRRPGGEQPA